MKPKTNILYIIFLLVLTISIRAQQLPDVTPKIPTASSFTNYSQHNYTQSGNTIYQPMSVNQRNALMRADIDRQIEAERQAEERARAIINDAMSSLPKRFRLPSKGDNEGGSHFSHAFEQLKAMDKQSFSIKKATHIIENAFYEDTYDYEEFNNIIRQTGDFLRSKMQEFGYDTSNNLAKNFLLFQFFSDTLEVKGQNIKHLPLTYDFEDYMGRDDWSKMFVRKLLETGKGQCNSLPQLYLILAEEIGAEASLSLSPNHSYIKFQDNAKRKWYNVELTNGMLTTDAFILQSGFVKAEALQNRIYMHPLSKEQLYAHQYVQLALGYIRKYGYDELVNEIIGKALEIHPNHVNAQLVKSNYDTFKLHYALSQLGIGRHNFERIKHYPFAMELYQNVNQQYQQVDELGYEEMPEEAYQKWLHSVKTEQNKQENTSLQSSIKNNLSTIKQ